MPKELQIPFYDADDFHPETNISKMTKGIPLTDEDRYPWLEILSNKITEWSNNKGAVLACSALKEEYRKILQNNSKLLQFIYLKADKQLIINRLKIRKDHFMPVSLINSQFEILEEPLNAITINSELTIKEVLDNIIRIINK